MVVVEADKYARLSHWLDASNAAFSTYSELLDGFKKRNEPVAIRFRLAGFLHTRALVDLDVN